VVSLVSFLGPPNSKLPEPRPGYDVPSLLPSQRPWVTTWLLTVHSSCATKSNVLAIIQKGEEAEGENAHEHEEREVFKL